jgi:hypothetical protein
MNARQREALFERCCGGNEYPLCNLCELPILPGQDWDESHIGAPAALGGRTTGVAHRRCNRQHGSDVVTPMVAKVKRIRRKHLGIETPGMGKRRMAAGRNSRISKTMRHGIVPRLTLGQRLERMGLVER